jgi:hypothetical protein
MPPCPFFPDESRARRLDSALESLQAACSLKRRGECSHARPRRHRRIRLTCPHPFVKPGMLSGLSCSVRRPHGLPLWRPALLPAILCGLHLSTVEIQSDGARRVRRKLSRHRFREHVSREVQTSWRTDSNCSSACVRPRRAYDIRRASEDTVELRRLLSDSLAWCSRSSVAKDA